MELTQNLNSIEAIIAEAGYEVFESDDQVLMIRDPESRVKIHAVLEQDLFYMSVVLSTVETTSITPQKMRRMLSADNGISTSSFQLYDVGTDRVAISLNNFCKLQTLGEDDRDDILSCLSYLLADILQARALFCQETAAS